MNRPTTQTRDALLASAVVVAALVAGLTATLEGAWLVAGFVLTGVATGWWRDSQRVRGAVAATIGGWLIVRVALGDGRPLWMGVVGVATCVSLAAGIGRAGRSMVTRRVLLASLAVTCGAVWACVPETDAVRRFGLVLGGAAAIAALVDVEVLEELLGAAAAALLFMALAGGQYRASAVVGAVASFGLLAVSWLIPLVSRLPRVPRLRIRAPLLREGLLVGCHSVAALVASRVAGRGRGLSSQVVVAVSVSVALVVAAVVLTQDKRAAA